MSSTEQIDDGSEYYTVDEDKKTNHFNSKLDSYRLDITKFQEQLWRSFRATYGEQATPGELLPGIEQCIEITKKENNYHGRTLVDKLRCCTWECFALIHPTAGYLTQETDSAFCALFTDFDIIYTSLKARGFRALSDYALKSKHEDLINAFRISPLSPEWHIRTHLLKRQTRRIVDIWILLEPELLSSASIFTTIAEEIYHVLESLIDMLYKVTSELEFREQVLRQHLDTEG